MVVDRSIVPAASTDMQEARAIFVFLLIDALSHKTLTVYRSGSHEH